MMLAVYISPIFVAKIELESLHLFSFDTAASL